MLVNWRGRTHQPTSDGRTEAVVQRKVSSAGCRDGRSSGSPGSLCWRRSWPHPRPLFSPAGRNLGLVGRHRLPVNLGQAPANKEEHPVSFAIGREGRMGQERAARTVSLLAVKLVKRSGGTRRRYARKAKLTAKASAVKLGRSVDGLRGGREILWRAGQSRAHRDLASSPRPCKAAIPVRLKG